MKFGQSDGFFAAVTVIALLLLAYMALVFVGSLLIASVGFAQGRTPNGPLFIRLGAVGISLLGVGLIAYLGIALAAWKRRTFRRTAYLLQLSVLIALAALLFV